MQSVRKLIESALLPASRLLERRLVSDTRDLVSNHLPAAIIVYPPCHVAVVAATFLAAVLCTLEGHRSYVQGHVSMDLRSFTLGANRLKFSYSCFQVRQPLTFCDQFAARIDEYVIISPNLLQRIQIALRKGLTVFPKSLLKILFNARIVLVNGGRLTKQRNKSNGQYPRCLHFHRVMGLSISEFPQSQSSRDIHQSHKKPA